MAVGGGGLSRDEEVGAVHCVTWNETQYDIAPRLKRSQGPDALKPMRAGPCQYCPERKV